MFPVVYIPTQTITRQWQKARVARHKQAEHTPAGSVKAGPSSVTQLPTHHDETGNMPVYVESDNRDAVPLCDAVSVQCH